MTALARPRPPSTALVTNRLPLKLHHANSAKEARELLQANPMLRYELAVALIDVVMETDHAGLDLCKYLREELGMTLREARRGCPTHRSKRAMPLPSSTRRH